MKKKSPPYAIIGAVVLGIVVIALLVHWKSLQEAAHQAELDRVKQEEADALAKATAVTPLTVVPTPTNMRNVYYASQAIEAGAKISSAFFEKKLTPNDILPEAYTDGTDVVGFYAIRNIEKGDPLTPHNIGKTLPFLTERITPGMRAVSLSVFDNEPFNKTGGFVVDDDKVDLLFTHLTQDNVYSLNTQMVMQNVRVLYVPGPKIDSETVQGINPVPAPGGCVAIVFEVTPEQAQALVYMSDIKNGRFSMILRARSDKDELKIKPFEGIDYAVNDYRNVQKRIIDPSMIRVEELRKKIEAASAAEKNQAGTTNETTHPTQPSP